MPKLLDIYTKTFDDGGCKFCQNIFIRKFLETTGMANCCGLPTPTKVEAHLVTDNNGSKAKIYLNNSYDSFIGMMLHLVSKIRPVIYFSVHQCSQIIHNTKASYETAVKRICWYLQDTTYRFLLFYPSNKMVVDCYADADFTGL